SLPLRRSRNSIPGRQGSEPMFRFIPGVRRSFTRQRLIGAALMAVVFALVAGTPVRAHEMGTTRVSVLLEGGTYNIEIVTDAGALVEKLEASIGGSPIAE